MLGGHPLASEPDLGELQECPSCGMLLGPQAVLCVDCGYHLKLGKHLSTSSQPSEPASEGAAKNPDVLLFGTSDRARPWTQYVFESFWFAGRVSRSYWWTFNLVWWAANAGIGRLAEDHRLPEWFAV